MSPGVRTWLVLLAGAALLAGTVAAIEQAAPRQGGRVVTSGGPSAAEEAGEQQAGRTISRVGRVGRELARTSVVPLPRRIARPRPLPPRVRKTPPAGQPRVTTRGSPPAGAPQEAADRAGSEGPVTEAPAGRSEPPAADAQRDAQAAPPHAPILMPPVLLQAPAGYPDGAYRLVLERGPLAPQVRIDGREGRVVLRILVRADGSVGRVEIIEPSGEDMLDRAASSAAWAWRFSPATRDGVPIDAWVLIPVRFVIR